MGSIKACIMLAIVVCLLMSTSAAEDMDGKSRIELNGGFWTGSNPSDIEVSPGVISGVTSYGSAGGLTFSHYVDSDMALFISAGILNSSVESNVSLSGVYSRTVSVYRLLLGVRYYLGIISSKSNWNPYLSAGLGTFMADQVSGEVSTAGVFNETKTLSTFGGQIGAGVDIRLNSFLMLGILGGYNIMNDFSQRIADRDNYNGAELGLSISYFFGGN